MSDNSRPGGGQRRLSRRKWLQIAGTTVAAGSVAGCSGGGSPETTTESTETSDSTTTEGTSDGTTETETETTEAKGKPVDPVFSSRTRGGVLPNELQWNQYNPKNKSWVSNTFLFDRLAMKRRDGDWIPSLAESWNVTDSAMTIDIHPDATWHDGEPVTGEDLALKFDIELIKGGAAASFFDAVNATGEKSVELTMPKPRNKNLTKTATLNYRLNTPPSVFGDVAESLRNASGEEEKKKALGELSSIKMSEPVGNGPFKYKKASVSKLYFEKHDEYHFADRVGVEEVEFHNIKGGQPWANMRDGGVDGVTGSASAKISEQFPDYIRHDRFPSVAGKGFLLNNDYEPFSDWRVRRAICWLHDQPRTKSAASRPDNLQDPPLPVGHNFVDWLSDEVKNNLNQYNSKVDKERAAALLEEASFTKEGGQWIRPNGEEFKITMLNRGDLGFFTPFKQQLEEFGIKAEARTESSSKWAKDFFDGNFQVFYSWWGLSLGPDHPWYQMQWEFDPGLDQYVKPMGKDVENLPVPMPVGDPDGDVEKVNALERFKKLGAATSQEEFREHLDFLSWAWNMSTPVPQIWVGTSNHWANTKSWNWPSTKEMIRGPEYPYYTGWRTGNLTPKRE